MKEELLAGRTCSISSYSAIGRKDTVAGDDYGYRVVSDGCADGLG